MGYAIHVRPLYALSVVTLTGHVDGAGLLRALDALASHPARIPGGDAIWDARTARTIDLVPDDLPLFSEATVRLAPTLGPGRSAVLCRDAYDEVTVQLLAVSARGHPGHQLRPFLTWREAARWLHVPEYLLDGRHPRRTWWPPVVERDPVNLAEGWRLNRGVYA